MLKKILNSRLVEASFWSILSELTLKVVTPITYLVTTKYLNPDEFGAIAVITTIVALLSIVADLGVSKLIIQHQESDENSADDFIHHCVTISLGIGILLMVLLHLTIDPLVKLFDISANKSDLFILAFNVPFLAVNGVFMGLLKKDFNFKKIFTVRIISVILPNIIAIILVIKGFGVTSLIVAQLFSSILSCGLTYLSMSYVYKFVYRHDYNKLIFGKSFWNSLEQIFMWLPMSIDVFLMNKYLSKSEIGLYTTSRTLFTSAIALTLGAISPVVFSLYSKFNKDLNKLYEVFCKTHYFIFLLSGILGVFVYLFFDLVEPFIFNIHWKGVGQITGIVFLLLSVNYFINPFQDFFNSLGDFRFTSMMVITNLIITVPFLFLSVQHGLITYLVCRFSFLFLKIIPVNRRLSKMDVKGSLSDFFYRTKFIWVFILVNVVSKTFFNNLTLIVTLFIASLCLIIYMDRHRVTALKKIFQIV